MEILFYSYLFFIGACFGSFASVVISRLKLGKKGIFLGRSHCPSCKNNLAPIDLVPIFSYIFSGGRCRQCGSRIGVFYLILELVMGASFVAISYLLIDLNLILSLDTLELVKLFFYLSIIFLTVVFVFYDLLYLEIPDSILFILICLSFVFLGAESIYSYSFFPTYSFPVTDYISFIISVVLGVLVIGGMYYILFMELEEKYDILILALLSLLFGGTYLIDNSIFLVPLYSGVMASFLGFVFFYLLILLSGGKWMGGGDLRVVIFMGLLSGVNYMFLSVFLSYFIGTFIGLFVIAIFLIKKYILGNKEKKFDNVLPFGPFLALGLFIVFIFGKDIVDFYNSLLIYL